MRATVLIQNLKSTTCKASIIKQLNLIKGIKVKSIDLNTNELTFDYTTHNAFEGIRETIKTLGFPFKEHNSPIEMHSKSDFNCSVGRKYSHG